MFHPQLLGLFDFVYYFRRWVSERKFMEDLVVNRNGALATADAPFFFNRNGVMDSMPSQSGASGIRDALLSFHRVVGLS